MNSPLYIGVIIHPDKPEGQQVTVAAYGEYQSVVEGQTVREYVKATAEWNAANPAPTTIEPPMWDLYVCERRFADTHLVT